MWVWLAALCWRTGFLAQLKSLPWLSLPGQPDCGGRRVLFGSFLPGKCRAEDSLDSASWNNFIILYSFSFCVFPILIFRGEPHTVYILTLQPCKYHLNSLCDITKERHELPVVIYYVHNDIYHVSTLGNTPHWPFTRLNYRSFLHKVSWIYSLSFCFYQYLTV